MKIKLLEDCGIYKAGDVVEMMRRRGEQYITGGKAEVYVEPAPVEEKPKAKPKAKPAPKASEG